MDSNGNLVSQVFYDKNGKKTRELRCTQDENGNKITLCVDYIPNGNIISYKTNPETGNMELYNAVNANGKDITKEAQKAEKCQIAFEKIASALASGQLINPNYIIKVLTDAGFQHFTFTNDNAQKAFENLLEAYDKGGKDGIKSWIYNITYGSYGGQNGNNNYGQIGGQGVGLGDQGFDYIFGGAGGWSYSEGYSLGWDGQWYNNGSQEVTRTGIHGGSVAHY